MLNAQPLALKRIGIVTSCYAEGMPYWKVSGRLARPDRARLKEIRCIDLAFSTPMNPIDPPMRSSTTEQGEDVLIEPPAIVGWRRGDPEEELISREWLVTNGLGGYASGTIAGVCTRRYHGKLIAALPAPLGRYVLLNHLEESLVIGQDSFLLSGDEPKAGELRLPELDLLDEFRLEWGLPLWVFENDHVRLTKRIVMPHLQNTTLIEYRVESAAREVRLSLRPSVHFRPHESDVSVPFALPYECEVAGERLDVVGAEGLTLQMSLLGQETAFRRDEALLPEMLYRMEKNRGYGFEGALWTPGVLTMTLRQGQGVIFAVSTEPWEAVRAVADAGAFDLERERRRELLRTARINEADPPIAAHLTLAADQFIISPRTRAGDEARARATGEEPRTVIAGYHWFTDWGRDTMISLEGLTLATGRHREAGSILRTFAAYVRDGLIPNLFPEGENEGLYNTADATLWFFHAAHRYVGATDDRPTLRHLLPVLDEIIDRHLQGTRFGIGVDSDGLLRQGEEGLALTWMDAKMGTWVVTPRRGKAVEINALFYNALRILAHWQVAEGQRLRAEELEERARLVQKAFNERFWFEEGGYLYDVVDAKLGGNDAALRPNQLLSISLDYPVLEESRWSAVVDIVRRNLLTPRGLRSLAPDHSDYRRDYTGDLRSRDGAYHQGTVWSWLIGPYFDAWMKVHPGGKAEAASLLRGLEEHVPEAGVGSISEIFDAEAPFTARGCIAQAWGVAELLRCMRRLASG